MCFIFCCCCNWCNRYTSKCIEITILVLSIISLSVSIIALKFVDKDHYSKQGYACLIVVGVLIIILIFLIILILIWRYKSKINNTRNFAGSSLDIIGLILTIFAILFTGIWESFSISRFYDINNPCQSNESIKINKSNKRNLVLFLKRYLLTYKENKEEFCLENPNYNANIISIFEYISVFVCSSILEIILLVLLYFWFNDFRRIKFLVDGALVDSNTKESKIKYKIRKINNNNNHIIYSHNDYVVHYDIYGRPIFNIKKNKIKIININNNNKKLQNSLGKVKTIDESKMKNNNDRNINKYDDNKEKNDEKIIDFKNDYNNNKDGINIFNLNFSKNKRKIQISNLNMSKSSSTINVKDNSSFNNNKLPIA